MVAYRVIVALTTVRSAPQSSTVVDKLHRRATFEGYPAAHGWVARVGGGYVRSNAVALIDTAPVLQTGPHGLGDAVDRLAAFLPAEAQAALSDFAAEVISRAAAQSASVSVGLSERVKALEEDKRPGRVLDTHDRT